MTKLHPIFKSLLVLCVTLAFVSIAQAQATRTFVSGVGNDLDPCSRTAPCRTFSGALTKTAAGGEISTLDPGGYGTVNINKSMMIEGTTGAGYGSILATATTGVIVNDSATTPNTIIVTLRNLSINGAPGTGTQGVRFLSGKALHVENCQIANFRASTGRGIDVALTAAASQVVTVKDTFIRDCLGEGIRLSNTAVGGAVNAIIDNTRIERCNIGITGAAVSVTNIRNSTFSFNTTAGIRLENATSSMNIENSFSQGSPGRGIIATAGTIRLGGNVVTNNATGLDCAGGTISSYGNNKVEGNGAHTCVFPLPPLTQR